MLHSPALCTAISAPPRALKLDDDGGVIGKRSFTDVGIEKAQRLDSDRKSCSYPREVKAKPRITRTGTDKDGGRLLAPSVPSVVLTYGRFAGPLWSANRLRDGVVDHRGHDADERKTADRGEITFRQQQEHHRRDQNQRRAIGRSAKPPLRKSGARETKCQTKPRGRLQWRSSFKVCLPTTAFFFGAVTAA